MPVGQAQSGTQLAVSSSSVVLGQPLTLTATVAALAPGMATISGSVRFFDAGTLLGTAPLVGRQAVFAASTLGVGSNTLTATFGGDGNLAASAASPATVTVTKAVPSISLIATSQNLRPKQSTTLVAAVSGPASAASGTVTFLDNGIPVDTTTLKNGVAIFTTSKLHAGNNVFTVSYGGDTNDQPATTATGVDVVLVTKKGHGGGNQRVRVPSAGFRGRSMVVTPARVGNPTEQSAGAQPDIGRIAGAGQVFLGKTLHRPR